MIHSTTGLTPNEAHRDENSVEVKSKFCNGREIFKKLSDKRNI